MGTTMPLSKSLIILWQLYKHFVKYLFFANLVFSSRKVCFDLQELNAVFLAAKNITSYNLLSPNILWFTEELYIYLALIPPGTSQHLNGKVLIGLSKDVSPMPRYSQAVVTWPHHLANSLHWNFVNEYLFDYIDIHPMLNKVYQTYVYIYPPFYVFSCFIIFKTDHFLILTNGYFIKTMFIVYLKIWKLWYTLPLFACMSRWIRNVIQRSACLIQIIAIACDNLRILLWFQNTPQPSSPPPLFKFPCQEVLNLSKVIQRNNSWAGGMLAISGRLWRDLK